MKVSTTYVAIIVNLLSVGLPYLGITIGTDALTTTVQTITAILTGLWVLKERYARGDITVAGVKK